MAWVRLPLRIHAIAKSVTGDDVRTIRTRLGLTQEKFAHEIHVTVSSVNRWENKHAGVSALAQDAITALCARRGVAVGWDHVEA